MLFLRIFTCLVLNTFLAFWNNVRCQKALIICSAFFLYFTLKLIANRLYFVLSFLETNSKVNLFHKSDKKGVVALAAVFFCLATRSFLIFEMLTTWSFYLIRTTALVNGNKSLFYKCILWVELASILIGQSIHFTTLRANLVHLSAENLQVKLAEREKFFELIIWFLKSLQVGLNEQLEVEVAIYVCYMRRQETRLVILENLRRKFTFEKLSLFIDLARQLALSGSRVWKLENRLRKYLMAKFANLEWIVKRKLADWLYQGDLFSSHLDNFGKKSLDKLDDNHLLLANLSFISVPLSQQFLFKPDQVGCSKYAFKQLLSDLINLGLVKLIERNVFVYCFLIEAVGST